MYNLFWVALGWCTGVLSLMQWQVWRARRERHFMHFDMKLLPPKEEPKIDWDVAVETELSNDIVKIVPRMTLTPAIPAAPVTAQECPECGLTFKRVKTHISRKHPVVDPSPSDLQVVPELEATDG